MTELIGKLPRFDLFAQNFTPEITNWFPFYLQGFQQTTNYTYRLTDLTNLDAIWSDFHHYHVRSQIRKAEKVVAVRTDLGVERLLEVLAKTFYRQGLPQPYDREMVCRIDAACGQRGCRRLHDQLHLIQVVIFGHRERRDEITAEGNDLDQAVLFQTTTGFTNRGAAGVIAVAEFLFGKGFPGQQITSHNVVLQMTVHTKRTCLCGPAIPLHPSLPPKLWVVCVTPRNLSRRGGLLRQHTMFEK